MNAYGLFIIYILVVVALMSAGAIRQAIADRRTSTRWPR